MIQFKKFLGKHFWQIFQYSVTILGYSNASGILAQNSKLHVEILLKRSRSFIGKRLFKLSDRTGTHDTVTRIFTNICIIGKALSNKNNATAEYIPLVSVYRLSFPSGWICHVTDASDAVRINQDATLEALVITLTKSIWKTNGPATLTKLAAVNTNWSRVFSICLEHEEGQFADSMYTTTF